MSRYLVFLGIILGIPISFYAFLVPLTTARMERESAALIADLPIWSTIAGTPLPIPQSSQALALLLILMAVLAFGVYSAAVYLSWGAKPAARSRMVALIVAAVLWFIAFWALPNINTDIFNYIVRGRLTAAHQSNPYYTAADEFPDDPLYPYASKAYTQFRGGKLPAWMYLNNALAWVAGDNPITNLLLYRGVLFLISGANLFMIGLILKKLTPQHLLTGILIYAWNPITIIYSGSKVDTVMVFYLHWVARMGFFTSRQKMGWAATVSQPRHSIMLATRKLFLAKPPLACVEYTNKQAIFYAYLPAIMTLNN